MSKLFHTTNSETLLSGIHFDPIFEEKRKQWRKLRSGNKTPSKEAKEAYKAIGDSMVVSVKGGFNVQNSDNG